MMEDYTGIYRDVNEVYRRTTSIADWCRRVLEDNTQSDQYIRFLLDRIKDDLEDAYAVMPRKELLSFKANKEDLPDINVGRCFIVESVNRETGEIKMKVITKVPTWATSDDDKS